MTWFNSTPCVRVMSHKRKRDRKISLKWNQTVSPWFFVEGDISSPPHALSSLSVEFSFGRHEDDSCRSLVSDLMRFLYSFSLVMSTLCHVLFKIGQEPWESLSWQEISCFQISSPCVDEMRRVSGDAWLLLPFLHSLSFISSLAFSWFFHFCVASSLSICLSVFRQTYQCNGSHNRGTWKNSEQ